MQIPCVIAEEDPPRLCGEKPDGYVLASDMQGSPPPMRGKAIYSPSLFDSRGITPAYAGKRDEAIVAMTESKDHPRLCGEKG